MRVRTMAAAVLLVTALTLPVSAEPVLVLTPVNAAAAVGGFVDIAVEISDLTADAAPSLSVFDLDLAFDATILSYVSTSYGDPVLGNQLDLFGLGDLTSTTPGSGFVNLFQLSLDSPFDLDSFQADRFVLATLTFLVDAPGVSPLTLGVNALGDSWGDPIVATVGSGSFTGSFIAVPEPTTVLLLVPGILALAGKGHLRRCRER